MKAYRHAVTYDRKRGKAELREATREALGVEPPSRTVPEPPSDATWYEQINCDDYHHRHEDDLWDWGSRRGWWGEALS